MRSGVRRHGKIFLLMWFTIDGDTIPSPFFPDEPTRTTTYEEEKEYDDSGNDEISITGI